VIGVNDAIGWLIAAVVLLLLLLRRPLLLLLVPVVLVVYWDYGTGGLGVLGGIVLAFAVTHRERSPEPDPDWQ
jgi:hypothetical protein